MVASEPFPRAGVAVVGGECADGQGDGVAERSGMWGGTPNRPATGPGTSGGRPRPMGDGASGGEPVGTGPPRRARPRRRRRTGGTPSTGTPPSRRSSRRCAVARWRRPRGGRSSGLRLAPEPVERPTTARRRPRSRSSRPCTRSTRTRRAATTQRPSTRPGRAAFRGGRPARVGRFPRAPSRRASGGFHEVEPLCVERVPLAGRRAVRIRLVTGRCPPTCTRGAASLALAPPAEPRASCIGRTATARASVDPLRPGLVRPARAPRRRGRRRRPSGPRGTTRCRPSGDRHRAATAAVAAAGPRASSAGETQHGWLDAVACRRVRRHSRRAPTSTRCRTACGAARQS